MYKKGAERVDVWMTIRWMAPSTLLDDTESRTARWRAASTRSRRSATA